HNYLHLNIHLFINARIIISTPFPYTTFFRSNDEVVIGDPSFPQLIYGLTGNLAWHGFDLSMLWQGADQSSFLLTNEASNPFFNGAKIFREQLDYWTPENRDATYPVIMPTPTPNSTQTSSWWIRDGRYLRLKNLEIGY